MTNDERKTHDMALVHDAINRLMDHFDTVHVFVTRHMPAELDGTMSLDSGAGHWLARRGQINDFMVSADERVRQKVRAEE